MLLSVYCNLFLSVGAGMKINRKSIHIILSVILAPFFLFSYIMNRRLVIFDILFGIPYWCLEQLNLWAPGPSWVEAHRFLAILCFLIWPILASLLLSYILIIGLYSIKNAQLKRPHLVFILVALLMIVVLFIIRADPGVFYISYSGYSSQNF